MATMEKAGKRWRVRQFVDGKLRTVASCATKTEAQSFMRRIEEQERARGAVPRGSQLPMGEILARWERAKVGAGNDVRHTQATVVKLRNLAAARNWSVTASVSALAVSDYRESGGSHRTGCYLAAVLRWAADTLDQYVDPKALVALRRGRPARRPSPVLMAEDQVAEAEARAGCMSTSAAALVHCLSTYGWRPITAARLTVADFDPLAGTITCRVKGGDVVRHALLGATVERLSALAVGRAPTDPLFLDPRTGERWEAQSGISEWSRNHLRLKVYDLKRYAISTMLGRGVPAQDVAAFTGHRTISQVLRYSRSNEERQRATLEAISGKPVENAPEMARGWRIQESLN